MTFIQFDLQYFQIVFDFFLYLFKIIFLFKNVILVPKQSIRLAITKKLFHKNIEFINTFEHQFSLFEFLKVAVKELHKYSYKLMIQLQLMDFFETDFSAIIYLNILQPPTLFLLTFLLTISIIDETFLCTFNTLDPVNNHLFIMLSIDQ